MNNIYKPTYLRELCERYYLSPSKKYGQNYLISDGVIKKIVEVAGVQKTDTVVEIGPGFGVLTFALAEKAKKVVSFEIEKKLEEYWSQKVEEFENVEIIWGNALKEFGARSSEFGDSYKVVANIPYQITSKLLRVILEAEKKPDSLTLMVQKEVAERIVAKPGNMSLLAVSVQYYGDPEISFAVPKGNFWPVPKVDSAVLHISTVGRLSSIKDQEFFRVVKAGFSNKRKQLWHNLSHSLGVDKNKIKEILTTAVGSEKIRAQELSVQDWERVVHSLFPTPNT